MSVFVMEYIDFELTHNLNLQNGYLLVEYTRYIVIYNNFEILQSNLSFQTEELPYQSYKSLDVLFVVQFSIFPFSYMIMRH